MFLDKSSKNTKNTSFLGIVRLSRNHYQTEEVSPI
jgi:hypothetical protein